MYKMSFWNLVIKENKGMEILFIIRKWENLVFVDQRNNKFYFKAHCHEICGMVF